MSQQPDRSEEKMDEMITIMVAPWMLEYIDLGAARENRTRSAYIRSKVLADLQAKGLVDENFDPIPQTGRGG